MGETRGQNFLRAQKGSASVPLYKQVNSTVYTTGQEVEVREINDTKTTAIIVRMAELEHARLKVWAYEQGTNMSRIIRDRISDIIVPKAMQRTQQGQ